MQQSHKKFRKELLIHHLKINKMTVIVRKSNCLRDYHQLLGIKLEKRLEEVKIGVYGNTNDFATPPKTMVVVASFLLNYVDKKTKWIQVLA